MTKTLSESIPRVEFLKSKETEGFQFKDVKVLKEFDGKVNPWLGTDRHVTKWFALANGKAVGINESPKTSVTFPVYNLMERD